MEMQGQLGKKAAAGVLCLLVIVSIGFVLSQNSKNATTSTPTSIDSNNKDNGSRGDSNGGSADRTYAVDCPQAVVEHCQSLSQKYKGNVTFKYKAQYTSMNGSAYYVKLKSGSVIADTGSKTATIKFDGQSGRVWSIQ